MTQMIENLGIVAMEFYRQNDRTLAIWWLSQHELDAITPDRFWPNYLKDLVDEIKLDRLDWRGGGQLWAERVDLGTLGNMPSWARGMGGIVLEKRDLVHVPHGLGAVQVDCVWTADR